MELVTLELAGVTAEPEDASTSSPGGDHGSLQHDPAVVDETIAFLLEHLVAP